MRVTNSVYVLSGSYFAAVNDPSVLGDVYGIRTPEGVILVDCGIPQAGPAMIRESLAYWEIPEPVTHVIITHAHYDHCGGAKEFQDAGAKIVVSRADAFYCENGGNRNLETPFNDDHIYPAFRPDIIAEPDCDLTLNGLDFRLIAIPGHTPGSMAVQLTADRKTLLFTGDALQPDGRQLCDVTLGWQGDPGFSRTDIVNSMMKLMKLETDMILPGHGKVCLRGGTKMLRHAARTAFLTLR